MNRTICDCIYRIRTSLANCHDNSGHSSFDRLCPVPKEYWPWAVQSSPGSLESFGRMLLPQTRNGQDRLESRQIRTQVFEDLIGDLWCCLSAEHKGRFESSFIRDGKAGQVGKPGPPALQLGDVLLLVHREPRNSNQKDSSPSWSSGGPGRRNFARIRESSRICHPGIFGRQVRVRLTC